MVEIENGERIFCHKKGFKKLNWDLMQKFYGIQATQLVCKEHYEKAKGESK